MKGLCLHQLVLPPLIQGNCSAFHQKIQKLCMSLLTFTSKDLPWGHTRCLEDKKFSNEGITCAAKLRGSIIKRKMKEIDVRVQSDTEAKLGSEGPMVRV